MMSSTVGSRVSLRMKSWATPCVWFGPTTLANRTAARISNMWQYARIMASHPSFLAPYGAIGRIGE